MLRSIRIYFLLLLFLFPFTLRASEIDSFYIQVKELVEQATHKREGVLIWTSLQTKDQKIFGNKKWASEKFLPGSIFKLIVAQSSVENNLSFQYKCTGFDSLEGKKRHCWTYKGHGLLDLPQALAISCNLYFENLGEKLGLDKILSTMKEYPVFVSILESFDKSGNFDLPRFSVGDEPSFRLSPLEVSQFWDEYVVKIQDSSYDAIFQGLRRSVGRGGTASKLKASPLEILAKTGTGDALNKNYKTNAWFLGAYPAKKPQYTLVILLQEAHGFEEATLLAQKVFSRLAENLR